MSYLDNPAGRLHELLAKGRSLPPNTNAATGWQKVFNIGDSPSELMRYAAHMSQLADDTERLVRSIFDDDDESDLYLRHMPEIRRTLALFLQISQIHMEQFYSGLPQSAEYSLEFCSKALHVRTPEIALSEGARPGLLDQLDDLFEAVRQAEDIEPETREWVLESIREIAVKLQRPDLFGGRDLQKETSALIGGFLHRLSHVSGFAKTKTARRLLALIVALDLAINLGANTHELAAGDPPPSSPIVTYIQQQIEPAQGRVQAPGQEQTGDSGPVGPSSDSINVDSGRK